MTLRALAEASAYCSLMTLTAVDDGDPDEVPVLHRTAYDTVSCPTASTVMVPVVVFASGALFGSVFLSVVASTTALVRHNLPAAGWPRGIGAFTIVFAAGQIVGPSLVGWVADGPGGLVRGFVVSAGVLALGALVASRQKPLGGAAG